MIYYTSDLHLGHANIIKLCSRPFYCLEEMNEALINNWNKAIHNDDTIYIVGDLMFRTTNTRPEDYLNRLKGKKHLIIGNHDKSWLNQIDATKYFESVENVQIIATSYGKITLCHYPMMSFEGKYLIYGHIHGNKNDTYWSLLKTMENALNASVEINEYKPVNFDELVENNKKFRTEL
ncbi:MAG: metallophosphoesterase family protein [Clostridia bacterium]|nr:metallophosphoesterase family protein [Clostridia bacterium]